MAKTENKSAQAQATEQATTLRKIEVFYKKMTTKDGKKFKKWLTKTKDEKIYQVSFVYDAKKDIPSARSYIYVLDENMNWNKNNPQYPVLYVKKVEKVEPIESSPEEFDNYFEKA